MIKSVSPGETMVTKVITDAKDHHWPRPAIRPSSDAPADDGENGEADTEAMTRQATMRRTLIRIFYLSVFWSRL
jgi:hypothetical protein